MLELKSYKSRCVIVIHNVAWQSDNSLAYILPWVPGRLGNDNVPFFKKTKPRRYVLVKHNVVVVQRGLHRRANTLQ